MKNKKNLVIGIIVSISVILSVMIFLGYRHSSSLANEYIVEIQTIVDEFEQSDNREVKLEAFDKLIELKRNYTDDKSIFKNIGEYKDVLDILDEQVNELVMHFKEEYEKILDKNAIEDVSDLSKEEVETNLSALSQLIDLIKTDEILQEEEIAEFENKSTELVSKYNTKLEEIKEAEKAEAEAKAKAEQEAKEKAEADAKAKAEQQALANVNKPSTGGGNASNNKPSTGGGSTSSKPTWKNSEPDFGVISPKGCTIMGYWVSKKDPSDEEWLDSCDNTWNRNWDFMGNRNDWEN
ncbi:hypothetical protein G7059_09465 [Erysipelothrix sp. HDW6A]|uniref:hypothetical protein n=1 Tax=Erysipelothrix sp. HDW6A TaxID=2714928 RepID=UPI0014095712|nr:hypothetical protein [Erysipelothrix sp. HDW6A]QIK58056.1 hypothetical protein G7059_09465 [Erysipelothrix sp. HDW6A]